MKHVFLTSSLDCCYKENDIVIAKPINNVNKVIDQIKEKLDNENNFLFLCSSSDNYEKNDSYANITFKSFNMSGFNFKKLIKVDDRYTGNLDEDIKNASLIFLSGGHTPTEMKFFDKINLKERLKNYSGVIIGQSAGSINLAKTVVCAPEYEEEIGTEYVWEGLGQTDINIEPHFILNVGEEYKKLREELLKLSEQYKIYAICDGSHIYDDGINKTLYGEAYLIDNRNIEKICNSGKNIRL